jgi:hypothetical protein
MFPVRYELNSYILFRRNFVFKGLNFNILYNYDCITYDYYYLLLLVGWD